MRAAKISRDILMPVISWITLGLIGCENNVSTTEQIKSNLGIDFQVSISLWENLSPDQRTFVLRCATRKIYPCMNYSIVYGLTHGYTSIRIDFLRIELPGEICMTALGPATATVSLGPVSGGKYALTFTAGDGGAKADLVVTQESYKVQNIHGDWVSFPHQELGRVPNQTIWGLIEYHAATSAHFVQSFLDSLRNLGAREHTYPSGYYGYFEIDTSGSIKTPSNHGYYFATPFIFQFTGDMLTTRNLLKNYGKSLGDSLSISLYGSSGEIFYSWVLRTEP